MVNDNPNTVTTVSQKKAILEHLLDGKTITPLEAMDAFRCMRLSGRIWDLRNEGYAIKDRWVTVGTRKKVKEYYMEVRNGA